MVVVGVNYRLGAFGFLASEELARESGDGSVGNYGLADQTAGMEWVKRNAAAFGGDPGNVTIVGESAGGGSVCAHLASPQSKGLFHRAVIESGGGCERLAGRQAGYASSAQLFERLGCADIACLRAKPTEDIIATGLSGNFVNDGVRLTQTGREAAAKGELGGVTVITGSNAEEAVLFTISEEEPSEERLYQMFGQLTDDPAALLALYPPERYPTRLARYREMYTEAAFTCPTLAFAQAARNDVYVYHFVFRSIDDRWAGIGPTHGVELAFLFGHPEGVTNSRPGLEGREATVSAFMQDAWSSFVKTGTPGDASVWRRYRDDGKVTIIDDAPKLADQIREGRCEAVNRLTAGRRTPL
jgi:para-nitrobenzyl esterase